MYSYIGAGHSPTMSLSSSSTDDDDDDFATLPLYVKLTSRIIRRRRECRIVPIDGTISISIDPGDSYPKIRYTVAMTNTRTASLVLLSLRVTSQSASRLPLDCRIFINHAPRPYVIRRGISVSSLDEELITDGVAYIDDTRSLAFCSLNAAHFTAESLPAHSFVSKTHPYAALLREVVMAQQLEAMDPLTRRCADRTSLTNAPLEGSDGYSYASRRTLEDARTYIERELVPHTQRTIQSGARLPIRVTPFAWKTWAEAFSESPLSQVATATITFRAYGVGNV